MISAAIYVRASTDHQQYSTANQADILLKYAANRGFDVVRSYADDGRSGLDLHGRPALRQLLQDVLAAQRPFEALLVYDVSRWGRFQDTDESAHYEYLCRRSGVQLIYVAEPFENDGTPVATLLKSIKRAMAAEYSRELSNKVFDGQRRLIEMGFRQGGSPGLGLRRMLVGADGQVKGILKYGEQKAIQTDRVILVPGPPDEIALVNRIFKLFAGGAGEAAIARLLNSEGVPSTRGAKWGRKTLWRVLTNEKYIGNSIYNQSSKKLRGRYRLILARSGCASMAPLRQSSGRPSSPRRDLSWRSARRGYIVRTSPC
jgi:DNA invertase Pin-like site-specific DNA recombinase